MSESWRNGYDSWKLATPPWYDDDDEEAREEAYDREMQRREDWDRESRCFDAR